MYAIKIVIFFGLLVSVFGSSAVARDEDWGQFQFRKRLNDSHQVFAEYVRRDRGELFSNTFSNLYRLSWGGKLGHWIYLLGGAYVDFQTGSDEKRLHQFGAYYFGFENKASGYVRLGFKQRSFILDDFIYLRLRNRLHLNLLPQDSFGVSGYDEIFYVPDGHQKFSNGFNENRLGVGLRYIIQTLEIYLFHTIGYQNTPRSSNRFEWIQLQTIFSF